jgi:N-acetyl-alpha-D-glucosaminyl L-malate synthase BshA
MKSGALKIGMVCYPTIGGSGIVATELGYLFARAGHEVHFISYERPIRLHADQPNIHFHPVIVNEYALFKYPDYTLPLSVRIAEVSEQFGLDVLHVHYAVPHATAALLARLMLGRRGKPVIVTTLHGTDTNLLGNDPHYRPIIEYSIENSCGVTTVSESLKRQTLETFRITHPIEVIPNFYAPQERGASRDAVRRELGVKDDEVLLLHMSNVRPVKRVGDILEAFALLKNRPRARLLILAGDDFRPWEPELDRLGIRDRVLVRESVQVIGDYANAGDIGVYASEQESFGLGILETLAHGKPVVATEIGGIPEVVRKDETGLLVPVRQPAALAAAIDRLIENPALRLGMGEAAQRDVAARFDPIRIRDSYLKFYRARMGSGKAPGDAGDASNDP